MACAGLGADVHDLLRHLRDGADSLVIMLDGECSFRALDPDGLHIWWSAYAGMAEEITLSGPVAEVTEKIVDTRAEARARHGWIMDIYLLRYDTPA